MDWLIFEMMHLYVAQAGHLQLPQSWTYRHRHHAQPSVAICSEANTVHGAHCLALPDLRAGSQPGSGPHTFCVLARLILTVKSLC